MNVVLKPSAKDAPGRRHLTGIDDLTQGDIEALLDRAQLYAGQGPARKILQDKVILNLFLENSTRTRVSFEIAALRLGARVVNIGAEGSSVKKGESLDDTLKTLAAMGPDALVMRAPENGSAKIAAGFFKCPVLNGGDGTNEHPTQALLDALTLRQRFGRIEGLTVAICGDIRHSRVARSNVKLLSRLGATVRLAGPQELLPDDLPATSDMALALRGADAVMMLRLQKERMEKTLRMSEEDYFRRFGLDAEKLDWAKPGAVVMHPGPINRSVEIDGRLADDPSHSLILDQVANGVAMRMACLELLLA